MILRRLAKRVDGMIRFTTSKVDLPDKLSEIANRESRTNPDRELRISGEVGALGAT